MSERPSTRMIDRLLRDYAYLRRVIESIEPTTAGLVRIPLRGIRRGSPVEYIAIRRAELSMVLDAVERAWRSLEPELRYIARLKYRRGLRNYEIVKCCHFSRSALDDRLKAIRDAVAAEIMLLPEAIWKQFESKIEAIEQAE